MQKWEQRWAMHPNSKVYLAYLPPNFQILCGMCNLQQINISSSPWRSTSCRIGYMLHLAAPTDFHANQQYPPNARFESLQNAEGSRRISFLCGCSVILKSARRWRTANFPIWSQCKLMELRRRRKVNPCILKQSIIRKKIYSIENTSHRCLPSCFEKIFKS